GTSALLASKSPLSLCLVSMFSLCGTCHKSPISVAHHCRCWQGKRARASAADPSSKHISHHCGCRRVGHLNGLTVNWQRPAEWPERRGKVRHCATVAVVVQGPV